VCRVRRRSAPRRAVPVPRPGRVTCPRHEARHRSREPEGRRRQTRPPSTSRLARGDAVARCCSLDCDPQGNATHGLRRGQALARRSITRRAARRGPADEVLLPVEPGGYTLLPAPPGPRRGRGAADGPAGARRFRLRDALAPLRDQVRRDRHRLSAGANVLTLQRARRGDTVLVPCSAKYYAARGAVGAHGHRRADPLGP